MAADKKKKVTSTDIKLALRDMYLSRSSYFITECKTCSTYFPDTKALRTVKKALYRQIEEPVGVYKYIIPHDFTEEGKDEK